MSGLFGTFNILKKAMSANQYALNTTSHNIANANTEGYSRQIATMQAAKASGSLSLNSASGPGQLGTGVDVSEIIRTRDVFLDTQLRSEFGTLGRFQAREQFLSQIETIFMEPTVNGLSTAMGKMWDSWQELSRGPENATLRNGVLETSRTVTDMFNHTYAQLENLKGHADELTKGQIYDFNEVVKQITDLNDQIMAVKIGSHNPNDLMDKQDLMIDKLSKMMNISVTRGPLGEATIKSDGITIVGENRKNLSFAIQPITKNADGDYVLSYYEQGDTNTYKSMVITPEQYDELGDTKMVWIDANGNVEKASPANGSILGYASIYTEINDYKGQLNAMAKTLAYSVNTIHNDGKLPGSEGYIEFFSAKDGLDENYIGASNITVNPSLFTNLSLINTNGKKSMDEDFNPVYFLQNNGDRALAIAQLRDSKIFVNEFLESKTTIISSAFTASPVQPGNQGNLLISSSGKTDIPVPINSTDTLGQIADKINYVSGVNGLGIKVSVENNRLIMQSISSSNIISLSDSNSGDLLSDLNFSSTSGNSVQTGAFDIKPVPASLSGESITITCDGKKTTINLVDTDNLGAIANNINNQAKTDGVAIRATIDNNRLIIQSVKYGDSLVSIADSTGDSSLLRALKIYDKDSIEFRNDNSIISNYTVFSNLMKVNSDSKGTTISNYFQNTISMLGSSSKQAGDIVISQQALIDQLNIRKESVSGVSMDEEMANMIQYQRSYQAAARVVSTIDEMIDTVVNRMAR